MSTIIFSHANGFPAGTYRMLFDVWRAAGHQVHAVEKFGHDPARPPSNNWPGLRDELVALIEQVAAEQVCEPLYLVGHSLGGWCSVLAAAKRPDLVKGIVLMDSPLMGPWLAGAIGLTKPTPIFKRFSPGHVSKGRRQNWPSAQAAHDHFASKKVFARWHPQVLRDYISCGIEPDSQTSSGQRLSFKRDIETRIYNTLPHHIGSLLRRQPLRCDMAFIGGTESVEVRQLGMRQTERLTHGRVSWIAGSHLFPFERPIEAAAEVLRWLAQFSAAKPVP